MKRIINYLENFNAITAPKTQKDIKEEELYRKQQEIILKSQDELLRKKLLKIAGTGIVFGFIIEMITNDPINKERNFMLKFYLDDRSFAVYEFRKTNSGKYMSKSCMKLLFIQIFPNSLVSTIDSLSITLFKYSIINTDIIIYKK